MMNVVEKERALYTSKLRPLLALVVAASVLYGCTKAASNDAEDGPAEETTTGDDDDDDDDDWRDHEPVGAFHLARRDRDRLEALVPLQRLIERRRHMLEAT